MRTAVETLIEIYYGNEGQISIKDLEQAKAMEKEQIMNSFSNGYLCHSKTSEQYYNETFKSE